MRKTDRADLFRRRLTERMAAIDMSRSALARVCAVDRSTIAQLLNGPDVRLPNAHLAAACAEALGVSADWLLGLSDRTETVAEMLAASTRLHQASRSPADEQIGQWHREIRGGKIRHVPVSLPDVLKTDATMAFEYATQLGRSPEQAVAHLRERAAWLDSPGSDYEICMPLAQVQALAAGEGYWRGMASRDRETQIARLAAMCRQHYPSLRLYLFDDKKVYSAPMTVFGSQIAVLYLGYQYMVFREARQVSALSAHFDRLVRDADTDARTMAARIEAIGQGSNAGPGDIDHGAR